MMIYYKKCSWFVLYCPNKISAMLLLEFPKLETLSGGWLFHKATGKQIQHDLTLCDTFEMDFLKTS